MRLLSFMAAALLALGIAGCDDDDVMNAADIKAATPAPSSSAKADGEGEEDEEGKLPVVEFNEDSFVESEDSRDPFRDFAHLFAKKRTGDKSLQRKVKAAQFALDELKLVGIITRSTRLVMLEDTSGFAWTVTTGEYVGKAELVSVGGTDGREVAINWRVDRIRPTDVVFIREDTAHPEIPPTTRVMPLYPDDSVRSGG